MPAAAVLGAIGAAGAVASAVGSTVTAANRHKYAQYVAPDESNYQFGNEGERFYGMGAAAQNRDVDPFAKMQQQALVGQLQDTAAGKGAVINAANAQLQAGRDTAIKTAMALAGSARGPNISGAQIGAVNAGTQATQMAANQANQTMANTQLGALSQLGGVLGGMRTADVAEAQRKDQLEEFYMKMGASREEAALRARQQLEMEKGQRQAEYQRLAAAEEGSKVEGVQRGFNAMGQGFASLGAMGGSMGRGEAAGGAGGGGGGG